MIWISCFIICMYILHILIKYKKIPISLSSTYYMSDKKPWFSISIILTTILMMIPLMEASKPEAHWLVFLSCMGNIFCAFAPNFKEELEGKVHYGGAILAGVISQLWCCFHNKFTLILWLLLVPILWDFYKFELSKGEEPTYAFWAELICFINIYVTYCLL